MFKICSSCKIEKTVTEFDKNKAARDGLNNQCKMCRKAYRDSNKQKVSTQRKTYYQNTAETRRAYARNYYMENKDKLLAYQRIYSAENKDKLSEYYKEYYQNNKNKKAVQARNYYQRTKNDRLRYISIWRKTERGRFLKRRSDDKRKRAKSYTPKDAIVTVEQWNFIQMLFDYSCACCGKTDELTIDHILPLSKGGLDSIENIQPLCRSCNSRKNNHYIDYRPVEFIHLLYV